MCQQENTTVVPNVCDPKTKTPESSDRSNIMVQPLQTQNDIQRLKRREWLILPIVLVYVDNTTVG